MATDLNRHQEGSLVNGQFGRRARPSVAALLALLLMAGALWMAARPAAAQNDAGAANFVTFTPQQSSPDHPAMHPKALTFISLSPYLTSFQNQQTKKNQNPPNAGEVITTRKTHYGPLVNLEKLYPLSPVHHDTQYSSVTIGAWYWYSQKNSGNPDNDRFAGYVQYAFDQRLAAQLSIGGGTRLGIYEYYLFGLYSIKRADYKSRFSAQVGAGPYVPRRSIGNTGFTGLVNLGIGPSSAKDRLSYSASVWYVTFTQPVGGANLNKTNETLRLNFNVNYRL